MTSTSAQMMQKEGEQETSSKLPGLPRYLLGQIQATQIHKFGRVVQVAKWLWELIRPALLTPSHRRKLGPTAYLDGLRGYAAFMVYWQHHQVWAHLGVPAEQLFESSWGTDGNYLLSTFPFIRSFFTGGHCAVAVFFVISGRVLTAKPMALLHAGDYVALGDNLASALFRRWLRLYIPCICTTFLYMTSWHLFGIWTAYPDHQSKWIDEFWNWYNEFKGFSFLFRSTGPTAPPWFTYNFHMWSIPVEFRGSILVYTSLLAFTKCTRNARILLMFVLMYYFLYAVDSAHFAMFTFGMLLSDIDLQERAENLPKIFYKIRDALGRYINAFWLVLFVSGMYISGVPTFNKDVASLRKSPGWYYLSFLSPSYMLDYKWYYLFWASAFIVVAVQRLSWLRGFFESRICQYFGRISFAFYLVHGPILWSLSDRIYLAVGWTRKENFDPLKHWINLFPLSKAGPFGMEVSFILPHLVILPVTLWLAEIATKLFDEPSVKISHWIYRKALPS